MFGTSAKFLGWPTRPVCARRTTISARCARALDRLAALPDGFDYVYRDVKADVHLASISGGTDIISLLRARQPDRPG